MLHSLNKKMIPAIFVLAASCPLAAMAPANVPAATGKFDRIAAFAHKHKSKITWGGALIVAGIGLYSAYQWWKSSNATPQPPLLSNDRTCNSTFINLEGATFLRVDASNINNLRSKSVAGERVHITFSDHKRGIVESKRHGPVLILTITAEETIPSCTITYPKRKIAGTEIKSNGAVIVDYKS